MSTGPGPTRKDDGSHDASVDDIAELLVEDESQNGPETSEHLSDDGLEVMLETPGPVLTSTFLPPPPAPTGPTSEEGESLEDAGAATNLAYEDLLAKLVLPAKAPEPEPSAPAPGQPLPLPEGLAAPATVPMQEPPLPAVVRPSSPSLQVAPPTEERTLVTDNPLVAEEQQAAVREGRASVTREQPRVVHDLQPPLITEPVATVNGAAKFKYLMIGGLLVLGGMVLATVFLKLLMPTPAAQPPVVVAPPPVPQPPPAPPAQVQPLPPTPAPAAAAPPPAPAEPAEPQAAEPTAEEAALAPEPEKPRLHKREARVKVVHAAAPKTAPAPKVTAAAPAGKPAKGGKKGKGSSYADPFDN